MAILDRRLMPLVEMLAEIGMDWLAFELIEGIERGQEPIENEEALMLARERARQHRGGKFMGVPSHHGIAEPILGDKQLDWVGEYVYERLEVTLKHMWASLEALDELADSDREKQGTIAESSAVLVVLDNEETRPVGRIQVRQAQAQLGALRESLDTWLANARSDVDQ